MDDKLQKLTDKIYQEGVEKAQLEAEQIIKKAKIEAEQIIHTAKKQEQEIIKKAHDYSNNLKENTKSEIRLSSKHFISAIKQKIARLIKLKVLDDPITSTFNDKDFLKNIIKIIIQNWEPGQNDNINLSLLLSEKHEKELIDYFSNKTNELLNAQLDVIIDENINKGFKIGPKDKNFYISFSDKDFEQLFTIYLRPKIMELLYGEEEDKLN